MLKRVQKKLQEWGFDELHTKKGPLLVALSGGADSVCLLYLLKELQKSLGFEMEAIHVEHGIRGEESKSDAAFVTQLCDKLGVLCHVESVDVPAYAKKWGVGTEEAARILRYEVFSGYAQKKNGAIVLAHHMDDDAETVLFQMIRGSSISGVCGIRSQREDENGVVYLRPMLDISRAEIEAYLADVGQAYCVDSTNLETAYDRNYIRKEIIPHLKEINPKAVSHIHQTASALQEIRNYLMQETQKAMNMVSEVYQNGMRLDIEALKALHPALQKEVVYHTIASMTGSKKDISGIHVSDVMDLMDGQSGKRLNLLRSLMVKKEYDYLYFVCGLEGKNPSAGLSTDEVQSAEIIMQEEALGKLVQTNMPLEVALDDSGAKLVLRIYPNDGTCGKIPQKTYTKWFDYDKIKNGFCIRKRQSGDFFIGDAQGHKKKLKTYFTDEKIPCAMRNHMWLLAQDSMVFWLIGGRMSEHVKVSQETSTILEIQYLGGENDEA